MFTENYRSFKNILEGSDIKESLMAIDLMFFNLEESMRNNYAPGMKNKVFSAIYILTQLIMEAEKGGWSRKAIIDELPNTLRIHDQSSFARYIRECPRNIKGDFNMINMIVDRKEDAAQNSLGWVIGDYALNSSITQQHREKIAIQARLIKETCERVKGAHIISIACGSARDIELVQKEIKNSGAKIFLFDSDREALDDAVSRLQSIENQIETICMDVVKLPKVVKKLSGDNGNS
ncbi:unnamed protein product, partial [marine sediment metagenome]